MGEFKDPGAGDLEVLVADERDDFVARIFGDALVEEVRFEVVGGEVAEGAAFFGRRLSRR